MIKINPQHHAICEKCEKPFHTPNAVVVTELNHVNGLLHDAVICHVQVTGMPGFKSYDWADRITLWHENCWPGLAIKLDARVIITADTVKEMLTNMLKKEDQRKVYLYLHHALGHRV